MKIFRIIILFIFLILSGCLTYEDEKINMNTVKRLIVTDSSFIGKYELDSISKLKNSGLNSIMIINKNNIELSDFPLSLLFFFRSENIDTLNFNTKGEYEIYNIKDGSNINVLLKEKIIKGINLEHSSFQGYFLKDTISHFIVFYIGDHDSNNTLKFIPKR